MSVFTCIICQEDYINGSRFCQGGIVWSKQCAHIFHHSCLSGWLVSCRLKGLQPTCPKCGLVTTWKDHVQQLYHGAKPNLKRISDEPLTPGPTEDSMETNIENTADMDMDDGENMQRPSFESKRNRNLKK